MRAFTTFVQNKRSHDDMINTGIARGYTAKEAASALAVAIQGYDEETMSETEIIEQFIDDGWRFELLEVKTNDDGEPVRIKNEDIE